MVHIYNWKTARVNVKQEVTMLFLSLSSSKAKAWQGGWENSI